MQFNKNVPRENREFLQEITKQYEKETPMSRAERAELHKWVSSGRSPYENGNYVYGENGWPLDFINALRAEKEQNEWWGSLSEDERQELIHENDSIRNDKDWSHEKSDGIILCSGLQHLESLEDLPFQ